MPNDRPRVAGEGTRWGALQERPHKSVVQPPKSMSRPLGHDTLANVLKRVSKNISLRESQIIASEGSELAVLECGP